MCSDDIIDSIFIYLVIEAFYFINVPVLTPNKKETMIVLKVCDAPWCEFIVT